MRYNKLFFDLDHTLWDFEGNSRKTLEVLYHEFNLKEEGILNFEDFRERYEKHNEKFWQRFRNGFVTREDLRLKRMWHTLLDFKIGNTDLANQLSLRYLDILPQQSVLMPNTIKILDYCAERNYRLSIITNGFESSQLLKMKTSKIDHYFEQMITSEKSNSMKPKKEIFEFALQITNTKKEDCLMIGDSLEADILGAQQSGIDQVYYNPKQRKHSEKPTYEIGCLSELEQIFEK